LKFADQTAAGHSLTSPMLERPQRGAGAVLLSLACNRLDVGESEA
jgi:hypothetical protein